MLSGMTPLGHLGRVDGFHPENLTHSDLPIQQFLLKGGLTCGSLHSHEVGDAILDIDHLTGWSFGKSKLRLHLILF